MATMLDPIRLHLLPIYEHSKCYPLRLLRVLMPIKMSLFAKLLKGIQGITTAVGNLDHVMNCQTHRIAALLAPEHAAPSPEVPAAKRRHHIGMPLFCAPTQDSEQTRSFNKLNVAPDRRNDTLCRMRHILVAQRRNDKEETTNSCAQPH